MRHCGGRAGPITPIAISASGTNSAGVHSLTAANNAPITGLVDGQGYYITNEDIEKLQKRVAGKLGYKLVGPRLELYAVPVGAKSREAKKQ